jgi:hypothetical protein
VPFDPGWTASPMCSRLIYGRHSRYSVVKARRRTQAPDGYEYVRPQGTSIAGIMPVRLGVNVAGLLTAEITTPSTLKTMSTRKAKLHMGAQAIIYLCVATMNQFTTR